MEPTLSTDCDQSSADGRQHRERAENHCNNFCFDCLYSYPRPRTLLYYTPIQYIAFMAHTTKGKEKLLTRVRRIRGQVDAIERALESEQECADVLQVMAACRGALNGLMAEVMEGHVRFHVLSPDNGRNSPQAQAAEELIDVVRAYLK